MIYPNKTFVAEYLRDAGNVGIFKRTVVVVAASEETAKNYLSEIVGSEPDEITWLTDCNYKVIHDQTGNKELPVQAKILYSTHAIIKTDKT